MFLLRNPSKCSCGRNFYAITQEESLGACEGLLYWNCSCGSTKASVLSSVVVVVADTRGRVIRFFLSDLRFVQEGDRLAELFITGEGEPRFCKKEEIESLLGYMDTEKKVA